MDKSQNGPASWVYWDLSDILEKETGCSWEEGNKAIKTWMKQNHPDVFSAEGNAL